MNKKVFLLLLLLLLLNIISALSKIGVVAIVSDMNYYQFNKNIDLQNEFSLVEEPSFL
jgi:hypothetical protein